MRILRGLRSLGLFFGSVKGLLFAVSLLPAVGAFFAGWFDGLPWAERIPYVTLALAGGMGFVALALSVFERATSHLTTKSEKKRIRQQLNEMKAAGYHQLDTLTIAGIWAGTMDEGNVVRHLRFRAIKGAVFSGKLPATFLSPSDRVKVNKTTPVPISELEQFFEEIGVLDPEKE